MKRVLLLVCLGLSFAYAQGISWEGKKVSIVGDSYSAYKGTPGCLGAYYPGKTTVQNVSDMWWSQVIAEFGGELEKNCSQAGSDITVTWGLAQSFLYRAKDGQLGNPDVIMILGGLNDFWLHDNYRSSFRSGVEKFFDCLDNEYPSARKIVILNKIHQHIDYAWGLSPFHRKVLRDAAKTRNYKIIDLEGWLGVASGDFDAKIEQHPTAQGQRKIADCVIASLRVDNAYRRILDCLEMNEKCYMVTDYVPNLKTTKIEVYMRESSQGSIGTNVIYSTSGFVDKTNTLERSVSLMWRKGTLRYDVTTDGGYSNKGPRFGIAPEGTDAVITCATKGNSLTLDGFSLTGNSEIEDVSASGSLVIGAIRSSSETKFEGMGSKVVYEIVVSEGDAIVHEYVPALDLAGKATLYDIVDNCCLGVYGEGDLAAYDFDGAYINYRMYKAYDDLFEAYSTADSGDVVVVAREPSETLTVTGRVDVAIDTRGYHNVVMVSNEKFYSVVSEGGVLRITKNEDLTPRFDCASVDELFNPVDGKIRLRIANVVSGCYYAVFYAEKLGDPWIQVGDQFELERADYEIDAPTGDSFFVKVVMKDTP